MANTKMKMKTLTSPTLRLHVWAWACWTIKIRQHNRSKHLPIAQTCRTSSAVKHLLKHPRTLTRNTPQEMIALEHNEALSYHQLVGVNRAVDVPVCEQLHRNRVWCDFVQKFLLLKCDHA